MALLTLKDVGKIYVSEGNVAVGIRGVNLSFDHGEFVAVTGKSGSGKSTLLNVISGMDSYEEGELFIEGEPTSHYLQPDWEHYRENYISFIFQDYNIIESFTVLQNVELALMHIEDKKERRRKALELIERVGLTSHIKHKGSKLSGGQKQRTVIARALAKDSPIILADEPTGNLDSATSKEIVKLLQEVSKDKLVIVVTHNFDQVAECTTRHIRIFDGAVESDHRVKEHTVKEEQLSVEKEPTSSKKQEIKKKIKNGITLGRVMFAAKPRLSIFLCFLMIVGTLGIFFVTSSFGFTDILLEPNYMFNHIDGRLVLVKQSGEIFTDEELESLVKEQGARDYLHYDKLLDQGYRSTLIIPTGEDMSEWQYPQASSVYGKNYGDDIVGRYPAAVDEVLLYLPIYYQPSVGKEKLNVSSVMVNEVAYKLVGVKYYYDNNLPAECLFTDEGFRTATAIHFLTAYSNDSLNVVVRVNDTVIVRNLHLDDARPSFDIPSDKVYIESEYYHSSIEEWENYSTTVEYAATYHKYNYNNGSSNSYVFSRTFTNEDITNEKPAPSEFDKMFDLGNVIIISDEIMRQMAESVLEESYTQASLFFENDGEAHKAAERLKDKGYIAVVSDTTYEPDAEMIIATVLLGFMLLFMWIMAIIFLALFIGLCSSRALNAFKSDMAIMRSMGIQVSVIKIGMYIRMLISLIPAFALVVVTAILIFTSPKFNEYFVYLYPWQYALIFVGMILLTAITTHRQVKRLFKESVRKSLKGGRGE